MVESYAVAKRYTFRKIESTMCALHVEKQKLHASVRDSFASLSAALQKSAFSGVRGCGDVSLIAFAVPSVVRQTSRDIAIAHLSTLC